MLLRRTAKIPMQRPGLCSAGSFEAPCLVHPFTDLSRHPGGCPRIRIEIYRPRPTATNSCTYILDFFALPAGSGSRAFAVDGNTSQRVEKSRTRSGVAETGHLTAI